MGRWEHSPYRGSLGRDVTKSPEGVAAILERHGLSWGSNAPAAHGEWLKERFFRLSGNGDVVHEELARELRADLVGSVQL